MADVVTVSELRLHLGERIPNDGEEEDTNFTDEEIELIIMRAGDSFYLALAIGWAAKAGIYTDLIDTNENGSDRKLDQMWKHCDKQATRFEKLADMEGALVPDLSVLRAGAIGFDAFKQEASAHTFSIFNDDSHYTEQRYFPLKRFPQIKQ
jgi:hypothetical protein